MCDLIILLFYSPNPLHLPSSRLKCTICDLLSLHWRAAVLFIYTHEKQPELKLPQISFLSAWCSIMLIDSDVERFVVDVMWGKNKAFNTEGGEDNSRPWDKTSVKKLPSHHLQWRVLRSKSCWWPEQLRWSPRHCFEWACTGVTWFCSPSACQFHHWTCDPAAQNEKTQCKH